MNKLFDIAGKVALVTGGSRGIGEMIAEGFVKNGAKTFITSRKADQCDETAKRLSKFGECISIPADLTDSNEIKKVKSKVESETNTLNILVNNAGAVWAADFDNFPENGWDKVMDTNVKAMFFLTQQFIKLLEENGTNEDPSRIINIGSIDGLGIPRAETYSYPASKAAVHHLTKVMANRLAERNINVNAIAPGPFESQMMKSTLKSFSEEIINSVPRKRIGKPEDMAGASIFLSSKASAYITGIVMPVDGGSLIARRHME
tara:strand:+ start:59 stop:841 length:783 start_codon:yes stop_codon:yes gene_type:complete